MQAACYCRQKNEFSSLSLPSSLQNTPSSDAQIRVRTRMGQKRSETGTWEKSALKLACFLLRTLNPVERLVRDGVLSEKEAQLSRMFLHMAQGVQ